MPELIQALKKYNLEVSIIASGINSIHSPHAESTLKVARELGIKHYRMAYHKYDLKKPIPPQLANIKAQIKDLAQMNQGIGIQGLYQNHSGDRYFGAPLWDLYEALKDLDPNFIASALDVGHTTVEGGKSWPIQLQLLKPYIKSIYVKDPLWVNKKTIWKPLGQGQVSSKMIKLLNDFNIAGPISLHVEYLSHKDHSNIVKFKKAFENDLRTLKKWMT
jgi:sugar phosphate isomerase/epimerase